MKRRAAAPAILGPDSVLRPTCRCVVREQEEEFLVYNSRSDELHLLPPAGYQVYRMCDGSRTLAELEVQLEELMDAEPGTVEADLHRFLSGLVERGILEVDGDDA